MNLKLYKEIVVVLAMLSHTTADLVHGKCPQVTGTKFDCFDLLSNFNTEGNKGTRYGTITFKMYGFLATSSSASTSLNLFAFNFINFTSINLYEASLVCGDAEHYSENYLRFECRGHLFKDDEVAPIFGFYNNKRTGDIHIQPEIDIYNKYCAPYFREEFNYVTYTSPSKFFAIWGCHQINGSFYDRGMWVFGTNANLSYTEVVSIVAEARNAMNLQSLVDLERNTIINDDFYAPGELCMTFVYENLCFIDQDYVELENWKKTKASTPKNIAGLEKVAFFMILCVIIIGVVIVTCIYATK